MLDSLESGLQKGLFPASKLIEICHDTKKCLCNWDVYLDKLTFRWKYVSYTAIPCSALVQRDEEFRASPQARETRLGSCLQSFQYQNEGYQDARVSGSPPESL